MIAPVTTFIQQKRKRNSQASVADFRGQPAAPDLESAPVWAKACSPVTPASERTLYFLSSHLSIEQQPCALQAPAQCPEVIDQIQHPVHPTLRKHNPAQDKSWAAFEAKATPASDNNTPDTKATWAITRENKENKVSVYSLTAAMTSPQDFTTVRIIFFRMA